jgi:hypothetical protein
LRSIKALTEFWCCCLSDLSSLRHCPGCGDIVCIAKHHTYLAVVALLASLTVLLFSLSARLTILLLTLIASLSVLLLALSSGLAVLLFALSTCLAVILLALSASRIGATDH